MESSTAPRLRSIADAQSRGNVIPFPRSDRGSKVGGFWARPLPKQHERIRELHRARLTVEQIAQLVKLPVQAVRSILDDGPEAA